MKPHLIVFCDSVREAREGIEQVQGIPQKYCVFIDRGNEQKIRGFIDLPFYRFRPLTAYEQDYAAQHNMHEATKEVMIALQLDLTNELPGEAEPAPSIQLTPEQADAVMAAFASLSDTMSKMLAVTIEAMKPVIDAYNKLPQALKDELARRQVERTTKK